jgi:hypothetical protein
MNVVSEGHEHLLRDLLSLSIDGRNPRVVLNDLTQVDTTCD